MEKKYIGIIKKMLEERMSIREMAKRIGMPKSTLHAKLQIARKSLDEETSSHFDNLLISNKQNMAQKGGYAKSRKALVYENILESEKLISKKG